MEESGEGDKSFYRKFNLKASTEASPGIMETIIEKMGRVKVHFSQLLEDQQVSSQGRVTEPSTKSADYSITMVIRAVKSLQALVRDHGVAMEFIRELFNKQDKKLSEVEARIDAPGPRVTGIIDFTVSQKLDEKTKVISDKLVTLENKLVEVEGQNKLLLKKNKQLTEECDETRQRGLKGNLRITCPPRRGGEGRKDEPARREGRVEDTTEMILRLIKEKTGCHIRKEDVVACHRLPENNFSYILRVGNRSPGSGWESLAAGMVSGRRHESRDWFANDGVYLNFQLTEARSKLLNQVRLARKANHLAKFSVNQNGRVTILREKSPRNTQGGQAKEPWEVVKDMDTLQTMFSGVNFPLTATTASAASATRAVTTAVTTAGTQ